MQLQFIHSEISRCFSIDLRKKRSIMIPVKQLRPIFKTQICSLDWQVDTEAARLVTEVPLEEQEVWAEVDLAEEATTAARSVLEM